MDDSSFWYEPAGQRLAGCLGLMAGGLLLLCIASVVVYYCNRPNPVVHTSPWRNYDPSRPVTDIKELDYDRGLIIYRGEELQRPIRELRPTYDSRTYDDPESYYEDYYEDIYEYFHD